MASAVGLPLPKVTMAVSQLRRRLEDGVAEPNNPKPSRLYARGNSGSSGDYKAAIEQLVSMSNDPARQTAKGKQQPTLLDSELEATAQRFGKTIRQVRDACNTHRHKTASVAKSPRQPPEFIEAAKALAIIPQEQGPTLSERRAVADRFGIDLEQVSSILRKQRKRALKETVVRERMAIRRMFRKRRRLASSIIVGSGAHGLRN